MALKKLNQFNTFATDEFFEKLGLLTVGKSTWREFGTSMVKGTKIEVVICSDRHDYNSQNGEVVNNLYEKLTVKIPKEVDVPMNVKVRLVNPSATIYGDYRNQLAITADDIEVLGK